MWHKYMCCEPMKPQQWERGAEGHERVSAWCRRYLLRVSHHPNVCKCVIITGELWALCRCPRSWQLGHFYSSSPRSLSSALTCPLFNLSFYLFALTISTFFSICTIIPAPKREFDWCLADINNPGWGRGMFLSWKKIKQIKRETSSVFIETL